MSKIWGAIIAMSLGISFFVGTTEGILGIITKASATSIENIILIAGMTCFWAGIFNILEHTKCIRLISLAMTPVIGRVFGNTLTKKEQEVVSLNMTSNLIGAGNAATVYAVNAVQEMQKSNDNKKKASYKMSLFVLINTASIQLIPTNIISLRMVYGSNLPNAVVIPNLVISIVSLIIGIVTFKILVRVKRRC